MTPSLSPFLTKKLSHLPGVSSEGRMEPTIPGSEASTTWFLCRAKAASCIDCSSTVKKGSSRFVLSSG